MWFPVDPVPRESTLEFVAGSHLGPVVHAAHVPRRPGQVVPRRIAGRAARHRRPTPSASASSAGSSSRATPCSSTCSRCTPPAGSAARTAGGCCRCASSATTWCTPRARGRPRRRSPGSTTSSPTARRWTTRCSRSLWDARARVTVRRDRHRRPPGAARAAREVDRRRAGVARGAGADRRPGRHDARTPTAPASPPTRSACRVRIAVDRGERQPPLPVQAADPADGRGQPGHRAARRRAGRDQRGLPVGAQPARQRCTATSTSACAGSTATATAHDEVKRGLTAGTFQHECDHLDGVLFLDRVTDPTTFTTWEQFERFHRAAFVERITALRRRVSAR